MCPPATPADLAYLTAVDALRAFAARTLSPVELLDALIARAEQVEPQVNAFAETRFEQARAAARDAERRYAGRGPAPRPLEGLPVAAKEAQPLAGHPVTDGLCDRDGRPPAVATRTAWALERIEAAGGIIHARTTTSELCCMPMSHARRWGVTRNPWNLETSAGGSSGGSAAALAAGTTPLATGTDIGGSIRAPASFTGVVGYKPPHGRIPVEPPEGLDPWMHAGALARTVADVALLAGVMAGPHPGDPTSLPAAAPPPTAFAAPEGLRVAVCPRPGDLPVAGEVAARTLDAAERLRAGGAAVREADLDWSLEDVKRAMWGRGDTERARAMLAVERDAPGTLSPYTVGCFEEALAYAARTTADERAALERRIAGVVLAALADHDAVVIPTMGVVAYDAGESYDRTPLTVDGRPLAHFCDAALTPVGNVCSDCPVVSVPTGLASNGVPTGAQVLARPHDEHTALRVAAALACDLPWPPPIR